MGNCASKKSVKSVKISRKIFSSKMEKDQEIHSKGMSKKVVPYSKGEITSFGFKKKTISHLPVPVTLTSNSNKVLEAKEKDNNRGASQKNLSEGYQSGSSVESLCHAPFKSTPKVMGKKDARSNQQQDPIGSGANVSSGSMKNHSDATMNKFGFRRGTPPKPTDLNGRTGPFPVSRTSFLINQGPPDPCCLQGSLKKSDFITRSRSEGPQANFKQSLKSSNSVQSVLNESKSSLTNGTQPRKFTLQTSHLPKPQFPVRIFDTKTAKTAANYYRREGGRAESQTSQIIPINEDSGFESHSSPSNTLEKRIETIDWSPGSRVRRRLPACKGKKLEMKVVGNKFELLKENEESDSNVVTEISLIKLPPFSTSRSRTGVINTGLVEERTNQYLKRISQPHENSKKELDEAFSNLAKHSSNSSSNSGGSSKSSKGLSAESGEEKLFSDNRKSEKLLTSEGGSEADDMLLPGEAMADDDSLCLNFEEIVERHRAEKRPQQARFVQEAVETPNTIRLDALKLSKELKYKTFSSFAENKNSQKVSGKASVIVHLMKGDEEEEETFPCDNILEALSSDSDSFGDKGENKNNDKEKNFKMITINSDTEDLGIEIKELEDEDEERQELSPSNNDTDVEDDELEINVDETEESRNNCLGARNSPNCAGTPTHTSNSLSLSDGRDFLIDDEIADQPQLCFSEKYVEIPGADEGKSAINKSELATETCEKQEEVDVAFGQNDKAINKKKGDEEKGEKFNNRGVRLGSEGTLSPCDSIASDDLMLDFESNSFEETAGRLDLLNNYENIIEEINGEKCTDVPSQISHPRPIDSGKSPKTGSGNQCPMSGSQTDPGPGRRISKAIPNEDYVKIDKIAYQDVFHDVISMKTMLLNLKCLLSESEEDLVESPRLSVMESNGIADNNLKEELTDLRRQVLFLQQQLEEREKVVEVLKTKIKKAATECVERTQCNAATQTGLDRFQQEFPRFRICRITPVV